MTQNDMDVMQNGPLHDKELMHGLRPSFWFQVQVIYPLSTVECHLLKLMQSALGCRKLVVAVQNGKAHKN